MDSNFSQAEILEKEGIKHYNKDIRLMSFKELQLNFSAESSGNIIVSKVIKNIIWQVYEKIQLGQESIEGNIRSFWYVYVKPVMGKIKAIDNKTDPYDQMIDIFSKFVQDYGLFQYQDFSFDDENSENRKIGEKYPNIIIFSEKVGYMKLLQEFYNTYGVTVTVLGGQPSVLSTEYTVASLAKKISLTLPFYLLSIVDYDPSGAIIIQTYLDQLFFQGIRNIQLTNFISLNNYTSENIEMYKYPLPTNQWSMTINEKWIENGGGINGEMYGLEADSMPRQKLRELVKKELDKIILNR